MYCTHTHTHTRRHSPPVLTVLTCTARRPDWRLEREGELTVTERGERETDRDRDIKRGHTESQRQRERERERHSRVTAIAWRRMERETQ